MDQPISKSQKKRDADTIQRFGVALVALRVDQIKQLSLPDALEQAILEAKKLKSHGALRRQAQLIGKRMRHADVDIAAIFEHYARFQSTNRDLLLQRLGLPDPRRSSI